MKSMRSIWTFLAIIALFVMASTSHARGLKGVVKFHGHYAPCEVVKIIKAPKHPSVHCKRSGPKKDVIVVIGARPHLERGTTLILKFKGKDRTKVMGRISCVGKGIDVPAIIKECTSRDEYVIWIDEGNSAHIVIETEKPIFKRVNIGDTVILKAKVKRAIVEGC